MLPLSHTVRLIACVTLAAPVASAQWHVDALSLPRTNIGAISVGDLALFAGGQQAATTFSRVDLYDAASDTWTTDGLSVARGGPAAAAVGDLVLFAGGIVNGGGISNAVDAFDAQSRSWVPSANLSLQRYGISATTVGTKVLFAGGQHVLGSVTNRVDIYDASVGPPSDPNAWTIAALPRARVQATAVTVGDLAIFAGGWVTPGGTPVDYVDIYDNTTGLWSTTNLSQARILGPDAGAVVGTRAYFGGGHVSAMGGPVMSDVVDVFDAQTGLWSVMHLSVARGYVAATVVGNSVIFAGGSEDGHVPSSVVDALHVGTGGWHLTSLSQARARAAATTVGAKAMFAGGQPAGGPSSSAVVDVYEPLGVSYCSATPNSTGHAAEISASGSASVTANDLSLHGTGLPANAFAYFVTSMTEGFVANPGGSQGNLCLGGAIGRYIGAGQVQNSGGSGQIGLTLDLDTTPTPTGLVAAQAGETWHFQAWHRDIGSTSNFTDALRVVLY